MTLHPNPAPQAGANVTVDIGRGDEPFLVEDWWDRVSGGSWMNAESNLTALTYAMRSSSTDLPIDDEVLYGKDSHGFGHLVHVSEVDR